MTAEPAPAAAAKPFLGVYFVNCSVYGRLYKDEEEQAYTGRCPRCGCHFNVRIAPGGTSQRLFKAFCKS
ncbi:MAG: hypothetical protein ACOCVG_01515 [Verrucomicrobiota bacterium]